MDKGFLHVCSVCGQYKTVWRVPYQPPPVVRSLPPLQYHYYCKRCADDFKIIVGGKNG